MVPFPAQERHLAGGIGGLLAMTNTMGTSTTADDRHFAYFCDANGNVDVEDIRRNAEKYGDRLAALMVTYPSTHGVFEQNIVEICALMSSMGQELHQADTSTKLTSLGRSHRR